MNMNVEGKRVLVCGMARSGIAAAKLLISLGARVTITDTKPEGEFGGALDELRTPECTFALGQSADGLIAGQDIMVISPGIAWAKPFVQNAIAQGVEVMGELELGARLPTPARTARQRPRRWSASCSARRDARRTSSETSAIRSPRRRAYPNRMT